MNRYDAHPWPEELVVNRTLWCAKRLGWSWETEVGIPGWGRCDFLLYPKPWVCWLVEAKSELRQRGQLRRGLQQVHAYRHLLAPARTFLVASERSGRLPCEEWGGLFDIGVLDVHEMRSLMLSVERGLRAVPEDEEAEDVSFTAEITYPRWDDNRFRIDEVLVEIGAHRDSDGTWYFDGDLGWYDSTRLEKLGATVKLVEVPEDLRIDPEAW